MAEKAPEPAPLPPFENVEEPVEEAEVPAMKKPASKKPSKATAVKSKPMPAVAKTKAKAKSAPKKGKECKDKDEKKPKAAPKKKPAASSSTAFKCLFSSDADDVQEGEEEEKEMDPDVHDDFEMDGGQEDETKDRCKNNKFLKMLKANQLPEFLVAEWQRVKGLKVGRLEAQRAIVNAAIDRGADGRLCLNVEKRMFADMKDCSNKSKCVVLSPKPYKSYTLHYFCFHYCTHPILL